MKKLVKMFILSFALTTPVGLFADQTKIMVDNKEHTLLKQPKTLNGTTYFPLRELGNLLSLNVEYLQSTKSINITSQSQTLNIDLTDKNNVTITDNGVTYLPLRFIAETLGYTINYNDGVISISSSNTELTDDKPNTETPTDPSGFDTSKMSPSDASNIYNLQAFKDGRSLSVMPKVPISSVTKPAGMSDTLWSNMKGFTTGGVVLATGKLSDMPKDINRIKNGKEDLDKPGMSVSKITVNSKGVLQASRCGAPTTIHFKDGTYANVHLGGDASIGIIPGSLSGQKPGKTLNDIACIVVSDTQAEASYIFFVTGK